jgi:anti-sigma regulatory factor (Ser/Thr protein kinase)
VNARRLAVPAEAPQLPVLTRFLQEFWAGAALPADGAFPFELALEELFMNVVRHGSPAGTVPRVEVSLSLADGSLTMTVEDDGLAFDPLALPAPDLEASVEARPIGGLGVYLVRQMMDVVSYRRDGTHNQLRLTKHVAT